MTTKIYGMMQSKKGYFRALRHVITPGIGFTYTPESRQGLSSYTNDQGEEVEYSIFEGGIYGTPDQRESGNVNFSLLNSLEMKVKSKSDSGDGTKKIKILENLQLRSGYDIVKDSLNWSDVVMSGYTNLTKNINLNFGSTYSLYALTEDKGEGNEATRINQFEWNKNGRLARMTNANAALNVNFSGGSKKKKKKKEEGGSKPDKLRREYYDVQWDVPWTIGLSYTVSYSKPKYEEVVTQSLKFNGDLSLTKNWKIDANGYYNFDRQEIEFISLGIIRNLHCWEMSMNWIPIGPRQQYSFNIRVTANILEALKFDKRGF